jgi:hypothetical protein
VHDLQRPVVVAVVAVRVVQLSVHQVVDVVAVGNGFVPAAGTMPVTPLVAVVEPRGALRRVALVHRDPVLVHVVLVRVMETPVVEVVDVPVVPDGRVPTGGSMLVIVPFVDLVVVGHRLSLS